MDNNSLSYTDDRDKAYGITGMTITLVACDGEHLLSQIDLDAAPGETMAMTHAYGFRGNPRMSAKIVWSQTLGDLRTTASMALGNLACRRYVLAHRRLNRAEADALRDVIRGEAMEHCALEADEADALFDECLRFVDGIFTHSRVHDLAHSFAAELSERRNMSAGEAFELLQRLGLR